MIAMPGPGLNGANQYNCLKQEEVYTYTPIPLQSQHTTNTSYIAPLKKTDGKLC